MPDINNPDHTGATYSGLPADDYTVVAVDQATSCESIPQVETVNDATVDPVINTASIDQTACDPVLANGEVSADVGGVTAGYTFNCAGLGLLQPLHMPARQIGRAAGAPARA